MKPDESLFRAHLEEAPFQSGVDSAKWGLHGETKEIVWPNPILWVGADIKILPAGKIFLRFTVDDYPAVAPTACPWDTAKNARLENALWPKLSGKFAKVFRHDWNIKDALYAPCDRRAMTNHDQWKQQFPLWWWQAHFTIIKYLGFIHLCLNPIHNED